MKILLLILLFSVSSFAQNWKINKDHSEILFEIPYLKVSEVTGRFTKFEGQMDFNEKTKNFKSISLVIESQSIDTGNKMRDGHLKSNDFFKTSLYPTMTFKSLSVSQIKPHHYRADGSLTIRGVTKQTQLEFTTTDLIKDTWGFQNVFIKFSAKINRQDFKMVWNKTLPQSEYLVGDVVRVYGNLQLQPMGEKTPTTKHMIPDTQSIREREKMFRGESPSEAVSLFTEKVSPEVIAVEKTETQVQTLPTASRAKSMTWWFSLSILALLGFGASITLGTKAKQYIAARFHTQYVEAGLLGNITDLIVVSIVLVYAMAFWYVGWGT